MPHSNDDARAPTQEARALPELPCAAVTGGPTSLSDLRRAVIADVHARQRSERAEVDGALQAALGRAADELGGLVEPESVRYWLLGAHYGSPLALAPRTEPDGAVRDDALAESERQLTYLYATKQRLAAIPSDRIVPVQTAPAEGLARLADALPEALADDLDTPRALAEVQSFAVAVNALCDAAARKKGRINASALAEAEAGFALIEARLGLVGEAPAPLLRRVRDRRARARGLDLARVEQLIGERARARAQKDFAAADALQQRLLSLGVSLVDAVDGTTAWTLRDAPDEGEAGEPG